LLQVVFNLSFHCKLKSLYKAERIHGKSIF
jgi:hypothetical protein